MSPPPAKRTKVEAISGDALEEDFLLEDGFAAGSDEDEPHSDSGPPLDGEEDNFAPAGSDPDHASDDDAPPAPPPAAAAKADGAPAAKKRKANGDKPAKKRKPEQERETIALLKVGEVVDRLTEKQKVAMPKLSGLEMAEFGLREEWILDTSHITERSNLANFIREAVPAMPSTLAKVPKQPGNPRVLVLSGAALRVADLCREVKTYKTKEVDVVKLFAKHFKLAEHVTHLQKTKVAIAVGTPGRIGKLLSETDALGLTFLSHLILDASHLDSKQRSLLDMIECREDLYKHVLGDKKVMDRLKEGKMKIIIY